MTQVDTEGKVLTQAHLDPADRYVGCSTWNSTSLRSVLFLTQEVTYLYGTEERPISRSENRRSLCRIANPQEKTQAFEYAKSFLKEKGRPSWTPVTKVAQGVEPALFKSHFRGAFQEYIDTPEAFNKRVKQKSNVAAKQRQEKINVDRLHHPEKCVRRASDSCVRHLTSRRYAIAREEIVYGIPDKNYQGSFTEFELHFVKEKKVKVIS